jgi:allantoicase
MFFTIETLSPQARFRVYGNVAPTHPKSPDDMFDFAHVFAGGKVVFTSDQHFGVGSNLILPGRGWFCDDLKRCQRLIFHREGHG